MANGSLHRRDEAHTYPAALPLLGLTLLRHRSTVTRWPHTPVAPIPGMPTLRQANNDNHRPEPQSHGLVAVAAEPEAPKSSQTTVEQTSTSAPSEPHKNTRRNFSAVLIVAIMLSNMYCSSER